MSEISKSTFFKALPVEVNIYIGDYICCTQAQWRIVFNKLLIDIEYARFGEHYCHNSRRYKVCHTLLCDEVCLDLLRI